MAVRSIKVKVTPNARKASVVQEDNRWNVKVTAPAVDGKANKALIAALAEHFHVRKSAVRIVQGETSRLKVVEVEDDNL